MSLEKNYLIKYFLQYGDVKPLCRTNVLKNAIPPSQAGPLVRVHMENFHLT